MGRECVLCMAMTRRQWLCSKDLLGGTDLGVLKLVDDIHILNVVCEPYAESGQSPDL